MQQESPIASRTPLTASTRMTPAVSTDVRRETYGAYDASECLSRIDASADWRRGRWVRTGLIGLCAAIGARLMGAAAVALLLNNTGAGGGIRTPDLPLTRRLLYR
jgi:hypothetical protein